MGFRVGVSGLRVLGLRLKVSVELTVHDRILSLRFWVAGRGATGRRRALSFFGGRVLGPSK